MFDSLFVLQANPITAGKTTYFFLFILLKFVNP